MAKSDKKKETNLLPAAEADVTQGALPLRKQTKKETAFFGRRKGRPLRTGQNILFSENLPLSQIDISRPAPQPIEALFGKQLNSAVQIKNVRLEIGFGGGEYLLHEAERCPESGFIGIEPFINGMAKMLAALCRCPQKAANILLYPDDALHILKWLPQNSISGIDIFYPDPWPKKKHWKRRFINAENIRHFARILQKGGVLRFASDIDTYVNQVLQLMHHNGDFIWKAETAQDWRQPYSGWISTRYELKAKKEGRATAYLTFIRK